MASDEEWVGDIDLAGNDGLYGFEYDDDQEDNAEEEDFWAWPDDKEFRELNFDHGR